MQNNTISNYQDRFNNIDENLKNLLDKVDNQNVVIPQQSENIGVLPNEEVLAAQQIGTTTSLEDLINEESDNSLQDFDSNLKNDSNSIEQVVEQANEEIDFEKAVDDAVQKSTEKTDKKSKKKSKK